MKRVTAMPNHHYRQYRSSFDSILSVVFKTQLCETGNSKTMKIL